MSNALGASDAQVFETFVVPRYLSWFGEIALEMLAPSESAKVAVVPCRTGYPSQSLGERLEQMVLVGVDPSPAAIDSARTRASGVSGASVRYEVGGWNATALNSGNFSHLVVLHPFIATANDRSTMLQRAMAILAPGGQLLFCQPLRGSFTELYDLLREYALKFDVGAMNEAIETMSRPNVEGLSEIFEDEGFDDVDVQMVKRTLSFQSGRAFIEDPVTRLMILPDLRASISAEEFAKPVAYLRDAIDKYWSEEAFELTVHVGCATGTRPS